MARRGSALLDVGAVHVTSTWPRGQSVSMRVRCLPGMTRLVGSALARCSDTTSCYLVTGKVDCVAEIFYPRHRLARLTLDEVSSIAGVIDIESDPVTKYYRGVSNWRPGLITAEEVEALTTLPQQPLFTDNVSLPPLSQADRLILDALAVNGRLGHDALGRIAGVSESTARRRVEALRSTGWAILRTVFEPRIIGLNIEACVWLSVKAARVDAVGEALAGSPFVRYAAATMGARQVLAHLAVPDMPTLHECATSSRWATSASAIETSIILTAAKRSGIVTDSVT